MKIYPNLSDWPLSQHSQLNQKGKEDRGRTPREPVRPVEAGEDRQGPLFVGFEDEGLRLAEDMLQAHLGHGATVKLSPVPSSSREDLDRHVCFFSRDAIESQFETCFVLFCFLLIW